MESLGKGLGGLASLVVLRAANNALAELPDQLRRLGLLEFLDLADNRLQALPPTLTACTSLRVLRLPRNALLRLCPGTPPTRPPPTRPPQSLLPGGWTPPFPMALFLTGRGAGMSVFHLCPGPEA